VLIRRGSLWQDRGRALPGNVPTLGHWSKAWRSKSPPVPLRFAGVCCYCVAARMRQPRGGSLRMVLLPTFEGDTFDGGGDRLVRLTSMGVGEII